MVVDICVGTSRRMLCSAGMIARLIVTHWRVVCVWCIWCDPGGCKYAYTLVGLLIMTRFLGHDWIGMTPYIRSVALHLQIHAVVYLCTRSRNTCICSMIKLYMPSPSLLKSRWLVFPPILNPNMLQSSGTVKWSETGGGWLCKYEWDKVVSTSTNETSVYGNQAHRETPSTVRSRTRMSRRTKARKKRTDWLHPIHPPISHSEKKLTDSDSDYYHSSSLIVPSNMSSTAIPSDTSLATPVTPAVVGTANPNGAPQVPPSRSMQNNQGTNSNLGTFGVSLISENCGVSGMLSQ